MLRVALRGLRLSFVVFPIGHDWLRFSFDVVRRDSNIYSRLDMVDGDGGGEEAHAITLAM